MDETSRVFAFFTCRRRGSKRLGRRADPRVSRPVVLPCNRSGLSVVIDVQEVDETMDEERNEIFEPLTFLFGREAQDDRDLPAPRS